MSDATRAAPGATLPGWPFSYVDRVRFGDLDAMRHLNNVAFLQFFESARIAYITTVIPSHRPTNPDDDWGLIFAECHINYRAPAFFDEEIRTHVRPAQLRRSSLRIEFLMTSEGDGRLLAEGWGALVGYDYGAGTAAPLPQVLREIMLEQGEVMLEQGAREA
ncbi:MAG TPA: thioesterase family protein [Solirubrobacteraceae bacterium]|nr:thioesterase family protein [Solirubrobacteraceae bacterium]